MSILNINSSAVFLGGEPIPLIGLGTYLCSNEEAKSSVVYALSVGYRHIDTAEYYKNHEGVAAGIKESGIDREKIFITDKLSPGGIYGMETKTYDTTISSLKHHLKRLDTTYIDLYLVHHAFPKNERINQYRALVDMQKEGLIKHIGVSNWNIKHIEEIRSAGLPLPAANQIEIHPLCQQTELVEYMRHLNILPIAYSSLAPCSTWRHEPGHLSAKDEATSIPSKYSEVVEAITQKYNYALTAKHHISEAQMLLRWALQKGYPILPKSTKPERILENINLFHFELSSEDMNALDSLDQNTPFAWSNGNPLSCE